MGETFLHSGGTSPEPPPQSRRDFSSTLIMAGGLCAGYSAFFAMAARYLYPVRASEHWLFVADAAGIPPGGAVPFVSPAGIEVTITRRAARDPGAPPVAADFLALSSVCPHLGCRVHWEPHNDRYFCPCHNGVFDPQGNAVSGPPAQARQSLPRYPLGVEDGILYIQMPAATVGRPRGDSRLQPISARPPRRA